MKRKMTDFAFGSTCGTLGANGWASLLDSGLPSAATKAVEEISSTESALSGIGNRLVVTATLQRSLRHRKTLSVEVNELVRIEQHKAQIGQRASRRRLWLRRRVSRDDTGSAREIIPSLTK